LAVAFALAAVSYALLEQPILRGTRLSGAWPRFVTPIVVVGLVGGLVAITASPPESEVTIAALGDGTSGAALATPVTANASRARKPAAPPKPKVKTVAMHRALHDKRPLRVLVVGDSVGITLGRGFELWARSNGFVTVDNAARKFCPLARGLPAQQGMTQNESMTYCNWSSRWPARVRSYDPDIVIVSFSIWEGVARKIPNLGWRQPGDPLLDEWQLKEYQAAVDTLTAKGAHVVWLNAPCGRDVTISRNSPLWHVNRHTIPKLTQTRRTVHALDLERQLCRNGKFVESFSGIARARPDGLHFSDAGAVAIANWAMPKLLGLEPPPGYAKS
jgi:hypothetical protein